MLLEAHRQNIFVSELKLRRIKEAISLLFLWNFDTVGSFERLHSIHKTVKNDKNS